MMETRSPFFSTTMELFCPPRNPYCHLPAYARSLFSSAEKNAGLIFLLTFLFLVMGLLLLCPTRKKSLNIAVRYGDLKSVRLFVEQGADVDEGDCDGDTPLICASLYGHLDVVQYLVEQGASLDKADNHGWTPLHYAAARNGRLKIVRYLLEQGADRDKANNNGYTPLHTAAFYGHLEIVRYLLEQGADRDKADNTGWTPLHNAALEGYLETALLLMSYGANLNAKTNDGQLPIAFARTEEMKQAIRDEPRRRMDHGLKRATEQDRHSNAATGTHEKEEGDQGITIKNTEIEIEIEDGKVASEDEESEPSDDEEDE